MSKDCIYAKELVTKGRVKVNADKSIKKGVDNAQVKRKLQITLCLKSCEKNEDRETTG